MVQEVEAKDSDELLMPAAPGMQPFCTHIISLYPHVSTISSTTCCTQQAAHQAAHHTAGASLMPPTPCRIPPLITKQSTL
jgi:hypothetical protein